MLKEGEYGDMFGGLVKTFFPRKIVEERPLQITERNVLPASESEKSTKPASLLPTTASPASPHLALFPGL